MTPRNLAMQIVTLINSRPRSPTVGELEAIISRAIGGPDGRSCSELRLTDLKALYTEALQRRAVRGRVMHIADAGGM